MGFWLIGGVKRSGFVLIGCTIEMLGWIFSYSIVYWIEYNSYLTQILSNNFYIIADNQRTLTNWLRSFDTKCLFHLPSYSLLQIFNGQNLNFYLKASPINRLWKISKIVNKRIGLYCGSWSPSHINKPIIRPFWI